MINQEGYICLNKGEVGDQRERERENNRGEDEDVGRGRRRRRRRMGWGWNEGLVGREKDNRYQRDRERERERDGWGNERATSWSAGWSRDWLLISGSSIPIPYRYLSLIHENLRYYGYSPYTPNIQIFFGIPPLSLLPPTYSVFLLSLYLLSSLVPLSICDIISMYTMILMMNKLDLIDNRSNSIKR